MADWHLEPFPSLPLAVESEAGEPLGQATAFLCTPTFQAVMLAAEVKGRFRTVRFLIPVGVVARVAGGVVRLRGVTRADLWEHVLRFDGATLPPREELVGLHRQAPEAALPVLSALAAVRGRPLVPMRPRLRPATTPLYDPLPSVPPEWQ